MAKGNKIPDTAVTPAIPEAPKGNAPATVQYVVDDGENDVASLSIYSNFDDANNEYQGLLMAGYPNPRLYKATEYSDADDSKGNEPYKLSDVAIDNGHRALTEAIKLLCSNGKVLPGISLYRLVHPCGLKDAKEAVDKIRFPE